MSGAVVAARPETMEAGNALDERIAVGLMFFRWRVYPNGRALAPHGSTAPLATGDEPLHPYGGPDRPGMSRVPRYSTAHGAAWSVVEHFKERQQRVVIIGEDWYDGGSWVVKVSHDLLCDDFCVAEDERFPLAVCHAALAWLRHLESLPAASIADLSRSAGHEG